MTDCYKCKHISVRGDFKNGKLNGRIYSCDENKVNESSELINNSNCNKYSEHFNQRILGEYLLCLRIHKH